MRGRWRGLAEIGLVGGVCGLAVVVALGLIANDRRHPPDPLEGGDGKVRAYELPELVGRPVADVERAFGRPDLDVDGWRLYRNRVHGTRPHLAVYPAGEEGPPADTIGTVVALDDAGVLWKFRVWFGPLTRAR